VGPEFARCVRIPIFKKRHQGSPSRPSPPSQRLTGFLAQPRPRALGYGLISIFLAEFKFSRDLVFLERPMSNRSPQNIKIPYAVVRTCGYRHVTV
jgi:hypothetical protein